MEKIVIVVIQRKDIIKEEQMEKDKIEAIKFFVLMIIGLVIYIIALFTIYPTSELVTNIMIIFFIIIAIIANRKRR